MGAEDMHRQALNVFRMKLLGAEVVPVDAGTGTLKDAINEAIRDWVTDVADTHYVIGSAVGPHPYPSIVRELPVGDRPRGPRADPRAGRAAAGRLPSPAWAAAPTPSGIFRGVPRRREVRLVGVEAGGEGIAHRPARGVARLRQAAASCTARAATCSRTTTARSPRRTRSRAGLDYPGVGPEHAYLRDTGRVRLRVGHRRGGARGVPASAETEGIIPALESAHAVGAPGPGGRRAWRRRPGRGLPVRTGRQGRRAGRRGPGHRCLTARRGCGPRSPGTGRR